MKAFVEVRHVGQSQEEIAALLETRLGHKLEQMRRQVNIVSVGEPYKLQNKFGGFNSTRQDIIYEVQ